MRKAGWSKSAQPGKVSRQHLELIEAIDPRSWNPSDLHKELSRALSTVDEARTEYNEQRSRLQAAGGDEGDASLPDTVTGAYESSDGRSFFQWLQIGVALTLPLIIFGAVALALFVWMASTASDGDVSSFAQIQPAASPQATRNSTTGSGPAREDSKNSSGMSRMARASRENLQRENTDRKRQSNCRKTISRLDRNGKTERVSMTVPRRPRSMRKERRDGQIIFLLLLVALAVAVMWLISHLHP